MASLQLPTWCDLLTAIGSPHQGNGNLDCSHGDRNSQSFPFLRKWHPLLCSLPAPDEHSDVQDFIAFVCSRLKAKLDRDTIGILTPFFYARAFTHAVSTGSLPDDVASAAVEALSPLSGTNGVKLFAASTIILSLSAAARSRSITRSSLENASPFLWLASSIWVDLSLARDSMLDSLFHAAPSVECVFSHWSSLVSLVCHTAPVVAFRPSGSGEFAVTKALNNVCFILCRVEATSPGLGGACALTEQCWRALAVSVAAAYRAAFPVASLSSTAAMGLLSSGDKVQREHAVERAARFAVGSAVKAAAGAAARVVAAAASVVAVGTQTANPLAPDDRGVLLGQWQRLHRLLSAAPAKTACAPELLSAFAATATSETAQLAAALRGVGMLISAAPTALSAHVAAHGGYMDCCNAARHGHVAASLSSSPSGPCLDGCSSSSRGDRCGESDGICMHTNSCSGAGGWLWLQAQAASLSEDLIAAHKGSELLDHLTNSLLCSPTGKEDGHAPAGIPPSLCPCRAVDTCTALAAAVSAICSVLVGSVVAVEQAYLPQDSPPQKSTGCQTLLRKLGPDFIGLNQLLAASTGAGAAAELSLHAADGTADEVSPDSSTESGTLSAKLARALLSNAMACLRLISIRATGCSRTCSAAQTLTRAREGAKLPALCSCVAEACAKELGFKGSSVHQEGNELVKIATEAPLTALATTIAGAVSHPCGSSACGCVFRCPSWSSPLLSSLANDAKNVSLPVSDAYSFACYRTAALIECVAARARAAPVAAHTAWALSVAPSPSENKATTPAALCTPELRASARLFNAVAVLAAGNRAGISRSLLDAAEDTASEIAQAMESFSALISSDAAVQSVVSEGNGGDPRAAAVLVKGSFHAAVAAAEAGTAVIEPPSSSASAVAGLGLLWDCFRKRAHSHAISGGASSAAMLWTSVGSCVRAALDAAQSHPIAAALAAAAVLSCGNTVGIDTSLSDIVSHLVSGNNGRFQAAFSSFIRHSSALAPMCLAASAGNKLAAAVAPLQVLASSAAPGGSSGDEQSLTIDALGALAMDGTWEGITAASNAAAAALDATATSLAKLRATDSTGHVDMDAYAIAAESVSKTAAAALEGVAVFVGDITADDGGEEQGQGGGEQDRELLSLVTPVWASLCRVYAAALKLSASASPSAPAAPSVVRARVRRPPLRAMEQLGLWAAGIALPDSSARTGVVNDKLRIAEASALAAAAFYVRFPSSSTDADHGSELASLTDAAAADSLAASVSSLTHLLSDSPQASVALHPTALRALAWFSLCVRAPCWCPMEDQQGQDLPRGNLLVALDNAGVGRALIRFMADEVAGRRAVDASASN